jgi:hypothetical protein
VIDEEENENYYLNKRLNETYYEYNYEHHCVGDSQIFFFLDQMTVRVHYIRIFLIHLS